MNSWYPLCVQYPYPEIKYHLSVNVVSNSAKKIFNIALQLVYKIAHRCQSTDMAKQKKVLLQGFRASCSK